MSSFIDSIISVSRDDDDEVAEAVKKALFLKEVRQANLETAKELLDVIPGMILGGSGKTSAGHLRSLMEQVIKEINTFPVDKTGRWIGYVQGILAFSRILDVDAERDKTRERYHQAYKATGQTIPKTINI